MPQACVNSHKGPAPLIQGPGTCCAAFAAAGLAPTVGARVAATDAKGRCFVCEVKTSTSKKNPGAKVFKRGKSMGLCPTASHGCCSLLA
jgi:hypothetical protein